MEAIVLK